MAHRIPRGVLAQIVPSTTYIPQPRDRVTVTLSSFGANLPGVVIGACRPGWSTVRITEAEPGKPWPIIDVPNRRLRKAST